MDSSRTMKPATATSDSQHGTHHPQQPAHSRSGAASSLSPSSYRVRAADWGLSPLNTASEHRQSHRPYRHPRRGNSRKYNKLELLQLFQVTSELPEGFIANDEYTSFECQEPLNRTFFKLEKDAKINPGFMYARGRGIATSSSPTSPAGLSGMFGRGRGRGTGRAPPSASESLPAWASEAVDLDDKPVELRGFTDEERKAIEEMSKMRLGDEDQKVSTAQQQQEQAGTSSSPQGPIGMESMWYYEDGAKILRGPFPLRKLRDWVDAAFFHPDLPVKQEGDSEFVVLKDVIAAATSANTDSPAAPDRLDESLPDTDVWGQPHVGQVHPLLAAQHSPMDAPMGAGLQLPGAGVPTYGAPDSLRGFPAHPLLQPQQPHLTQPPHQPPHHPYGPQPVINPWHTVPQPLSVEQLESLILQGAVPMQNTPQGPAGQHMPMMNQAQLQQQQHLHAQQHYWNLMQQQQQQQRLSQDTFRMDQQNALLEGRSHPVPQSTFLSGHDEQQQQQQQQQPIMISPTDQQPIHDSKTKTRREDGEPSGHAIHPILETPTQERPSASLQESETKKGSGRQPQRQQPKKKGDTSSQPPPPPPQQQQTSIFFSPAPIQPRAVPPKPAEKRNQQPTADTHKQRPLVIHAEEQIAEESQYLYDRTTDRHKVTLSSVLPQVVEQPQQQSHNWVMPSTSAPSSAAQGAAPSLAEIQKEQSKQSKKQKLMKRKQALEELESKSAPAWGGNVPFSSGPSLRDIQQQEDNRQRKLQQNQKQNASVRQSLATYSAKVASSSPSAWASPAQGGGSLRDILADEERKVKKRQNQQQQQQQQQQHVPSHPRGGPTSLAEQLARTASGLGKGHTGKSKPAIQTSLGAVQPHTQSPVMSAKPSAHAQDAGKYDDEDDVGDTLWDYSGGSTSQPSGSVSAFTSQPPAVADTRSSTSAQEKQSTKKKNKKKGKKSKSKKKDDPEGSTDEFPSLPATAAKKSGKKSDGTKEASAFGLKDVPDEHFEKWYRQQLANMGQEYAAPLFYFLVSLETGQEIDGYVTEYFGSSNGSKKFAEHFKAYKKFHEGGGRGKFNPASAIGKSDGGEQFRKAVRKKGKGGKKK